MEKSLSSPNWSFVYLCNSDQSPKVERIIVEEKINRKAEKDKEEQQEVHEELELTASSHIYEEINFHLTLKSY